MTQPGQRWGWGMLLAQAGPASPTCRAQGWTPQSEMCPFAPIRERSVLYSPMSFWTKYWPFCLIYFIYTRRKTAEAEDKQRRGGPFVPPSSDDLDNDKMCPAWASLCSVKRMDPSGVECLTTFYYRPPCCLPCDHNRDSGRHVLRY